MKSKTHRRILAMLAALIAVFSLISVIFAASGSHISTDKVPAVEIKQGEQYALCLADIFTDAAGHTLTYEVEGDAGNQSTTNLKDGVYYFTSPKAGTYTPVITASCQDACASVALTIIVTEGEPEDQLQYNYDETPADSVTVYMTVSCDGIPIMGNDEERSILSHVMISVPYFDLGLYGLEDFYRYATENGSGVYTDDQVIKRPTAMHLFIYMLESYYLGYPESECGTGEHKDDLFGERREDEILNMFGDVAYTAQGSPLAYSGSATSTYMVNFWGHDENLMYYRNHRYPLMSPGWGATSDYILLSDGDAVDLAMFTNWEFYTHGAFCCIGKAGSSRPIETLTVAQGEQLRFTGLKYGTQSVSEGGSDSFVPVTEEDGMIYRLFDKEWTKTECQPEMDGEDNGQYTISTRDLDPGIYHLVGMDPKGGSADACMAPAAVTVYVQQETAAGDVNGDSNVDAIDLRAILRSVAKIEPLTSEQEKNADINRDGIVDAQDVTKLAQLLQ